MTDTILLLAAFANMAAASSMVTWLACRRWWHEARREADMLLRLWEDEERRADRLRDEAARYRREAQAEACKAASLEEQLAATWARKGGGS